MANDDVEVLLNIVRIEFDDDSVYTYTSRHYKREQLSGMTDSHWAGLQRSYATSGQALINRFVMYGKDGAYGTGIVGAIPKRYVRWVGADSNAEVPSDAQWTVL